MKKIAPVIIILIVVLLLLHGKKPQPQTIPVAASNSIPSTAEKILSATNAAPAIVPAAAPENVSTDTAPAVQTKSIIPGPLPASALATNAANLSPEMVLDNMRVAIHNYQDAFGENPVGDNAEITAALSGKNPKQVNFLRDDAGLSKNDKGELLDAWGTPFFFHQVSGKVMEIHSAGQDRKMWTFDDLVTR
jgi:hypothetical protein